MPVVLLVWAVAGVRLLRATPRQEPVPWRTVVLHLVWSLLLALLVAVLVPPAMRMQFDETSLCGTAQNMHRHRAALMSMVGVPGPDGVEVLDWTVDKRPPLFPFLTSVLHDLTGYRVANAFAVNLLSLWALLALLGAAVRRWAGAPASLAAQLLVLAVPLVPHVATGAGFELLAALLLACTVQAALAALRDPRPVRIVWLLANGLLFAQARYESIAVFAVLLAVVGFRLRGALLAPGTRWLWWLAPVLLAPAVWQLLHARDPAFYLESGGASLLGPGHFATHVGPFLAAFFAPALTNPLPGALGIVAAAVYVGRLVRGGAGFDDLVVALPVLTATAITLAWFYGDVREPTALRLFLPVAILAALAPVLLVRLAAARWLPWALLLGAAVFAGLRLAELARGAVVPEPLAVRVLRAVDELLLEVRPDPARVVVVTSVAQYLLLRDQPAITAAALPVRGAGNAQELLFVETPLDPQLAPWFGDVRALRLRAGAEPVAEIGGELPVAAFRLRR